MESLPLPKPRIQSVSSIDAEADVLAVAYPEEGDLTGALAEIDSPTGWVQRLVSGGQISGKQGELTKKSEPVTL